MLKRNPQDRINFEDFSTHSFLQTTTNNQTNEQNETFPNSFENNYLEQQQQQIHQVRKKTINVDIKKKQPKPKKKERTHLGGGKFAFCFSGSIRWVAANKC